MKASIDWNLAVADIGPRLYRYFCASFPWSIASDLVQEVFIRLVEKYRNGSFDPKKGSLRMFAFGIARLVRLEVFKTLPEENFFGDPIKYEWRVASNKNVIGSEDIDKSYSLRKAIAQLNEIQKEIILLLIDEDLTLADISKIIKIPIGTVKSHVHRAKVQLRNLLIDSRGG